MIKGNISLYDKVWSASEKAIFMQSWRSLKDVQTSWTKLNQVGVYSVLKIRRDCEIFFKAFRDKINQNPKALSFP